MPDQQPQWGDEEGEAPTPPAKPLFDEPTKDGGCGRTGCLIVIILLALLWVVYAGCSAYLDQHLK